MRNGIFVLAAVAVLGVLNWLVWCKEVTIRDGRLVLLELVPVDPRSLIQGDYMRLRYKVERDAEARGGHGDAIVLGQDPRGVAECRSGDVSDLRAPYFAMRVRRDASGGVHLGPDAWYFEEGQADLYSRARYAEMRVDEAGNCVLTGLRDDAMRRLGD